MTPTQIVLLAISLVSLTTETDYLRIDGREMPGVEFIHYTVRRGPYFVSLDMFVHNGGTVSLKAGALDYRSAQGAAPVHSDVLAAFEAAFLGASERAQAANDV